MVKKESKRGRNFAFVLYPDNEAQMKLLQWLLNPLCPYNCRTMYIEHEAEDADKKDHIHVVTAFDNPRSVDGVRKSFGVYDTVWRLYHMELTDIVDDLKKVSPGVFERVRKETYTKKPVLTDPDNPQSFVDYKLTSKNETVALITREHPEIGDDQCFIKTPLYTVPHVELVSDLTSYAVYMLHQTYDCIINNKKPYKKEDLKGNFEMICQAFPDLKPMDEVSIMQRIFDLCRNRSRSEVMDILLQCRDEDTLKFLSGHSTFVRDWFFDYRKSDDNET